ncbi:MAG TPA: response regulator [Candidatus Binatia bacterium]|nr:response regulator [Candidatus Binatia bacterium]
MANDGQMILVVEDELPMLNLLKKILEDAGFRVLMAKDGIEAIDVYSRNQSDVDLVLCDMALPKLGGWTVYLALKERNPQVKMILTSGYLDPKVKSDMVKGGVRDFIPKPYVPETIVKSVRQALGDHQD